MMFFMRALSLLLLTALVSCSKPHDLDTPCPNYGRHCPQLPINESLN